MKLDKRRDKPQSHGDTESPIEDKEIMFSGSVPLCLGGDARER